MYNDRAQESEILVALLAITVRFFEHGHSPPCTLLWFFRHGLSQQKKMLEHVDVSAGSVD